MANFYPTTTPKVPTKKSVDKLLSDASEVLTEHLAIQETNRPAEVLVRRYKKVFERDGQEYVLLVEENGTRAWWRLALDAPQTVAPVFTFIEETDILCYNLENELSEEAIESLKRNARLNFWLAGGKVAQDLAIREIKEAIQSTRFILTLTEE